VRRLIKLSAQKPRRGPGPVEGMAKTLRPFREALSPVTMTRRGFVTSTLAAGFALAVPFLVPVSYKLNGRQHQKEADQDDRCHHIHGRFAECIVHTIDQNGSNEGEIDVPDSPIAGAMFSRQGQRWGGK
jgi:hypothetical protein